MWGESMSEEAARHIGVGLAWMGFWLMIGLANFGEEPAVKIIDQVEIGVKKSLNQ